MKANEFRNLTTDELNQKVAGYKEELFNLRFQLATGQLDNPNPHQRGTERYRTCQNGSASKRTGNQQLIYQVP